MNQQQWHNRFSGQAQQNWGFYQSGYQNRGMPAGMFGQLEMASYQAATRGRMADSNQARFMFCQLAPSSEYLRARIVRDCAPAGLIAASDLEF